MKEKVVIEGLGLYIRRIDSSGPAAFAAWCKALGLNWVALGALWQDGDGDRWINKTATIERYRQALTKANILACVWGYPWLGRQAAFVSGMRSAAGDKPYYLLDPELGANPSRRASALPRANAAAQEIVRGLRVPRSIIGLSTFGLPPAWFPLKAYLDAGLDFAGGQTYTDNARIDTSIALFRKAIAASRNPRTQLIPNYGLYVKTATGGVRAKGPEELRSHLYEFVDDPTPINALVGWADNFVTARNAPVLAMFARTMERGALRL